VVFWTNVLDWAGGGGGGGGGGSFRETVTPIAIDLPVSTDWRSGLQRIKARNPSGLELSPWVLLGALACVLLAAAATPRVPRFRAA
jgi:hypothetical protein